MKTTQNDHAMNLEWESMPEVAARLGITTKEAAQRYGDRQRRPRTQVGATIFWEYLTNFHEED